MIQRVRIVGLLLATVAFGHEPWAAEQTARAPGYRPFPPDTYAVDFLLRGAADRSPDHYLVAVVEVASESVCETSEGKQVWTRATRVVDLLDAKIPSGQTVPRSKLRLVTSPNDSQEIGWSVGSRYLVVVVPVPGHLGVYRSTATIAGPSETEVREARHALKCVISR